MNIIARKAGTKMSGNHKREIITAVNEALTAKFGTLDGKSGALLNTDLSAFIADIVAAAEKYSGPVRFSSAVTTTLSDGSTITVLAPTRKATFVEWFTAALGVPADTPPDTLARFLKEGGHLVSGDQVREMQRLTDSKTKTGMSTLGLWGNWFPRQGSDHLVRDSEFDEEMRRNDRKKKFCNRTDDQRNWFPNQDSDNVSVGRSGFEKQRSWRDSVHNLANDYRWDINERVLLRNLDLSKLGL